MTPDALNKLRDLRAKASFSTLKVEPISKRFFYLCDPDADEHEGDAVAADMSKEDAELVAFLINEVTPQLIDA